MREGGTEPDGGDTRRAGIARGDRGDRALVAAKLVAAFLGFSALVTEIATLVNERRFDAGNFFSFFTVEANTLAVISLVVSSLAVVSGTSSERLNYFRGAVAFFMTTVILIFIVLLSGYPSADLTAVPWDNTVLHYVMPIVVLVDWVFPRRSRAVRTGPALGWLAVPLAYLGYSLVRGGIVGWYPYPFMDPSRHGYAGVLMTSLVIAVVLVVIVWVVANLPRWTSSPRR